MALLLGRTSSPFCGVKMASFTQYLSTISTAPHVFAVELSESLPVSSGAALNSRTRDLRYSPVMMAYLAPNKGPVAPPARLTSIGLILSDSPYRVLGALRCHLRAQEQSRVYFSEGLASIVLVNFSLQKLRKLLSVAGNCPYEYWNLKNGKFDVRKVVCEIPRANSLPSVGKLMLPSSNVTELAVYVEQIAASLRSLWVAWGIYFPSEKATLREIATLTNDLIAQYRAAEANANRGKDVLGPQKKRNAVVSALVEISGALSYAVTQGTSGGIPVMSNRSPFPHHSLLGVGGAVRALTKYTRYLEAAFSVRDATNVLMQCYTALKEVIPVRISQYKSGVEYSFRDGKQSREEHFDVAGKIKREGYVPLLAHFSLRHGFMENKFFITAASEALTAETSPNWTLMTLSHEIMHSRVRTIFQALFGWEVESTEDEIISYEQYHQFCSWVRSEQRPRKVDVLSGLRNAVLNFCYVFDISQIEEPEGSEHSDYRVSLDMLRDAYTRHKQLAIELFVHFHDYFFVYARQPKIYVRSLWASWVKVAGPYGGPTNTCVALLLHLRVERVTSPCKPLRMLKIFC